jgi:cholesterol oxidase
MEAQGSTWLSEGLESLLAEKAAHAHGPEHLDFDVIIIGSGYGGSLAASRLAGLRDSNGKALRIALLERGEEYLPGKFPSGLSILATHARFSTPLRNEVGGTRDGLFDIRNHGAINALVASGLGGGSLINAGVMEQPEPAVFDKRWPQALRGGSALEDYYARVKKELGAESNNAPNTISRHPDLAARGLDKTRSLKKMGGENFREAAITVAMHDGPNHAGVQMNKCKLCGDCATGCNFGAKDSLDLNLLVEARRRKVRLVTGALVLGVKKQADAWALDVTYTNPTLAKRQGGPVELRAAKVIFAAGSFGSTEILLRSASEGLSVSGKLGERFSGNGDMIAVGYNHTDRVNAVADETEDYHSRRIGPTITGVVDLRQDGSDHPVVVEEMAVPGAMRRVFEELYTTTASLQGLVEDDKSRHEDGNPALDPLAVDPNAIAHSAVYAVIGDDGGDGRITLKKDFEQGSDGAIDVNWPGLPENPLFPAQIEKLEMLRDTSGSGGRILANPLWDPLPQSMGFMLGTDKGPLMTVHPLGGCIMADDASLGAVDDLGRVFDSAQGSTVHEGLAVLDGSIIPSALCTNPALTIAAVSARALDGLIEAWELQESVAAPEAGWEQRPVYKTMPKPEPPAPTTMQFAERLNGPVDLTLGGVKGCYHAEITLFFEDKALKDLYAATDDTSGTRHSLRVATHSNIPNTVSQLRLFRQEDWVQVEKRYLSGRIREAELDRISIHTAPLSGSLTIMGRERSSRLQRVARAGWAWLLNRGMRDAWQGKFPNAAEKAAGKSDDVSFWPKLRLGLQWASHAGEKRLFEYRLQVGEPNASELSAGSFSGQRIQGRKHITYRHRGNPLRQLCEIQLDEFPGLRVSLLQRLGLERFGPDRELVLAPEFLARAGLPLFRIIREQDAPQAIADLLSLSAYFARLLASIHMLSFRKPDLAVKREPNRLPAALPGLPVPDRIPVPIIEELQPGGEGNAGEILLTRYRGRSNDSQPVLCIHGYSASGTTFAHPALKRDLARQLWHAGKDVWILDMRSSCGLQTAKVNYSFEELAFADIPVAVERVCKETGHESIDIVAHCMGAAMFSMAILSAHRVQAGEPYELQRKALPGRVRRAALSQVGPLVSLAPGNVLRAYLFSYLKHLLPLDQYEFQSKGTRVDELLDRLLTSLPYSDAEFDLENPLVPWRRTPWASTRHRMDLLYGETFALANLDDETLHHIDDFFGPLNVDTATQVAHFAKYQAITDHAGNNDFVSRSALRSNWRFPTLSVHGNDNGLSSVKTVGRMDTILQDAGCDYRKRVFEGFGHQDCLIGSNAGIVFAEIEKFLAGEGGVEPPKGPLPEDQLLVQVPWSGPSLGPLQLGGDVPQLPVSYGVNPALSDPRLLVVLPLAQGADGLEVLRHHDKACCHVFPAPAPENGWAKIMLPVEDESVQGLMLLLVYDECPDMDNALFGKGDGHMDFSGFQGMAREAFADAPIQEVLSVHFTGRESKVVEAVESYIANEPARLSAGIVSVPRWADDNDICLALGSCQFPPGILDEKPGFRSYRRLAQRLEQREVLHQPDLLLLMGDQVYVDPTAGLADPTARDERYVHPYQRWYRSREVRRVLRRIPVAMMLDDHEIGDNWEPLPGGDVSNQEDLAQGVANFCNFQLGAHENGSKQLWRNFQARGFDIFVADTRTQREHRDASNVGLQSLLGDDQAQALEDWFRDIALDRDDPLRPKFLVSPAMLAPRLRGVLGKDEQSAVRSDGWEGYPASQAQILQWIMKYQVQNLVCLSGDAHLSCVADLHLQGAEGSLALSSVHASALFAPYPFANAEREQYASNETFIVTPGLQCSVSTDYAPSGDGFATLCVSKVEGSWKVSVTFDRERGHTAPYELLRTPPRYDYEPPAP